MKKTTYSIQIDNPCAENWNEMTKTDKGKFCAMCEKNVIDFSKLTDNEILKIVESNNKNLCGRFTQAQLNRVLIDTNQQNSPKLYQILAGLLLFSSADANAITEKPKIANFENNTKNPIILENDTINKKKKQTDFTITGKIIDAKKEAIPGANIVLKGYEQIAAISNDNGNFSLNIPKKIFKDSVILMISAHIFEDKTFVISKKDLENKQVVLVEMKEDEMLNTVIIDNMVLGGIKREKTEGLAPRMANIHITQIISISQTDAIITGKITDLKKDVIPGANIVLKGNRQIATVSADNGEFSLLIPKDLIKDSLVIEISWIGSEDKTLIISKKEIESKKVFLVEMEEEKLGEMIVVAGGMRVNKPRKWWQFWKRRNR